MTPKHICKKSRDFHRGAAGLPSVSGYVFTPEGLDRKITYFYVLRKYGRMLF